MLDGEERRIGRQNRSEHNDGVASAATFGGYLDNMCIDPLVPSPRTMITNNDGSVLRDVLVLDHVHDAIRRVAAIDISGAWNVTTMNMSLHVGCRNNYSSSPELMMSINQRTGRMVVFSATHGLLDSHDHLGIPLTSLPETEKHTKLYPGTGTIRPSN
jgi:hypothetical protein